jgi:hypothetical protein
MHSLKPEENDLVKNGTGALWIESRTSQEPVAFGGVARDRVQWEKSGPEEVLNIVNGICDVVRDMSASRDGASDSGPGIVLLANAKSSFSDR